MAVHLIIVTLWKYKHNTLKWILNLTVLEHAEANLSAYGQRRRQQVPFVKTVTSTCLKFHGWQKVQAKQKGQTKTFLTVSFLPLGDSEILLKELNDKHKQIQALITRQPIFILLPISIMTNVF